MINKLELPTYNELISLYEWKREDNYDKILQNLYHIFVTSNIEKSFFNSRKKPKTYLIILNTNRLIFDNFSFSRNYSF